MMNSRIQQRVVIVGAGFAGFSAARELSRRVGATTGITVINSADYFLYLPLMPQMARNVAASLGTGKARPYKHHDEGFLVDLGGQAAAANPMNLPLSGPVASAVTRGYHLSAMSGNRARVLADWAVNAATPPQTTSFGVISGESVPLDVDRPPALALESTPPERSGGPR